MILTYLEENSLGQKQTWFQNGLSESFLTYKTRQGEALLSGHSKELNFGSRFLVYMVYIFFFPLGIQTIGRH